MAPLATLLLVSLAGISGCGKPGSKVRCTGDLQCEPGVCMAGTCVPRVTGRTLAVEILPRSDSSYAHTGIPSVTFGTDSINLIAEKKVVSDGNIVDLEGGVYSPKAHVVAMTPDPIPGQPDMQFETDLANFMFQLSLAQSLVGKPAAIWLIPDAQTLGQPPIPFSATLDPTLHLTFPGSVQMTVIRGVLHDSLNAPAAGFSARAFVGGNLVSNVGVTDDTGQFHVLIAPGAIPARPADLITVEFTKSDNPRFVTQSLSVADATASGAMLRTFTLPAFIKAAPLRFKVTAGEDGIPEATVRFHTEILAPPDGVAIYEQEKRTDSNGEVEALLIPGTATEARNYQITILPSPDSGYAGKCVTQHPVTIVGNDGQSPYSATFSLDPKVTLQGNVFGSDGMPSPSVSVTATPLGTGASCMISTAPISATALRNGHYQILLDPGDYRLDIDPPTDAPQARLTEDGDHAVWVSNDAVTDHDIALPAGEVVEGIATGPEGALSSAGIKFLEVLCQGATCQGASRISPALRAQTRTDIDGHFRAVLPLP